ncbi:MAG: hypothetical protein GX660_14265, partial [Clostridiaceae bacterium]|nr:hypothetical protein [Clostridiaceae bacterium]
VTESNLKIFTNIILKTNDRPIADAGEDQSKRTDGSTAVVTLDGSKSTDPDGDELTYTWTNEEGTTIGTTVKPDVELPVGKNTLTLTVSDGTKTSTDTVVITVTGNGAPVADAGEDQNKRTDEKTAKVTLDGSKSTDPDGDELTYTWTNEAGTTVGTTVKPVVELPVGKNTLTLTVSDGTETSTDTVVITVEKKKSSGGSNPGNSVREQENRPPVANAGEDQVVLTARGTEAVTMDGSKSSDPDGDELTYIWEDEEGERVGTTEKPIVDLPVGKNILKLTVSDGKLSSSDSVVIIVNKEEIPSGAGTTADVAISLTSDQMRVEENKEFVLSMKYINKTDSVVKNVYIEFDLPEDMQVIDLSEGKQSGNRIIWEIGDLDAKKTGQIDLKVKSNEIQQADIIKKFVSTIFSRDTELVNTYDDSSQLGIMIYSNRFNHVHKRYILGYPDKTFKGLRNITRAETAVIFARILDLKELTITNKNQFVDVKPGHWAEAHIYAVVQVELFKGVDSTHFDPDVPISRAELATVIANYLKISRTVDQKPFEVSFNDTKNHWAQGNIEEVVRHKIVNGYEDGSFKPEKKISRQEAVAMINRLLNRGPLTKVNNSFPDMTSEHWAFGDVEESVRTHEFIINDNGVEEMTKFIDESIW